MKDRFLKDSIILTLTNLATGILGFLFSIILSRELGPEGMGLYGLIMPVYNLFLFLSSGGMVTAISKISAVYFSKQDYKILKKSVNTALAFELIWTFVIASLVFIISPVISSYVIKDQRTLYSLMVLCPALIFVALSSILKGYFYGISKIQIPAFIDIFEKAVRITILLLVIGLFSFTTVTHTVMSAYIALCIGELVSLILLYIFYNINKNEFTGGLRNTESRSQLLFNVLVISFPLCLNGFLNSALSTLCTLIIPRRLVTAGFSYNAALSLIGKFSGMSLVIIFFPLIVISSMSTILVPDLSQSISKKNYFAMESRIMQVLKIAFLLGLCTSVICISIPNSLGQLFFNRNDLGDYIRFAAISAPFAFTSSTTYAILNGLGKQGLLLRNSIIVSIEEFILLYFLTSIPSINIFGFGITLIITSITTMLLNFYEIQKHCYLKINFSELIINLLIALLLFLKENIH